MNTLGTMRSGVPSPMMDNAHLIPMAPGIPEKFKTWAFIMARGYGDAEVSVNGQYLKLPRFEWTMIDNDKFSAFANSDLAMRYVDKDFVEWEKTVTGTTREIGWVKVERPMVELNPTGKLPAGAGEPEVLAPQPKKIEAAKPPAAGPITTIEP